MNSPIRQLIRSAASLGVLQFGGMILTFTVGVLLARQLGPSGYGTYALAMAVVTFVGMLTEFGLPILAMREFSSAKAHDRWGEARGLIRWADRVILGISAVVIGGFLTSAIIWDFAAKSTWLATMIWAILLVPTVAIAKLRGLALLSLGYTFAGQFAVLILRPGLFALSLAVIWIADEQLEPSEAMAWQVAAATGALIAVCGLFVRYRPKQYREAQPINRWKDWLSVTFPMGMTEGLRVLQGQTAILMLGILGTQAQVGLYRVADAAYLVCLIPASILHIVACPHFAKLHAADDRKALQTLISFVAFLVLMAVAVVALILLPFGEHLIVFAFGEEFRDSYSALFVLVSGWLLISLFGPAVSLCNMIGQERDVMIGSVLALTGQVCAAFLLIPYLEIAGAALGVIVGQVLLFSFLAVRLHTQARYNSTIGSFDIGILKRPSLMGDGIKALLNRGPR